MSGGGGLWEEAVVRWGGLAAAGGLRRHREESEVRAE